MTDAEGNTKQFHIGDIISVVDGHLVSLDHVGGLYNLLGWMVDEDLMTHQLSRVAEECEPELRRLFPDLVALKVPEVHSLADCKAWFARLAEQGVQIERGVPRLPRRDHARIAPVLEAQYLVGADKVLPVDL